MLPNVGDFVKFPEGITLPNEQPKFLYGTVKSFEHRNRFLNVELVEPFNGRYFEYIPAYLARVVDIEEYIGKSKVCIHEWVCTGESIIFGDKWYNCKKCDIKKEDSRVL